MQIDWKTPESLFDTLNKEFGFTLDVCALPWNAQTEKYFTPEEDGLSKEWSGVCWCNPPFDATQGKWVEKAYRESQRGCTVVVLFPGNYHDTAWFHNYALKASEIRYFRGRPSFLNKESRETSMRTMLLVFRPFCKGKPEIFSINKDGTKYEERVTALNTTNRMAVTADKPPSPTLFENNIFDGVK